MNTGQRSKNAMSIDQMIGSSLDDLIKSQKRPFAPRGGRGRERGRGRGTPSGRYNIRQFDNRRNSMRSRRGLPPVNRGRRIRGVRGRGGRTLPYSVPSRFPYRNANSGYQTDQRINRNRGIQKRTPRQTRIPVGLPSRFQRGRMMMANTSLMRQEFARMGRNIQRNNRLLNILASNRQNRRPRAQHFDNLRSYDEDRDVMKKIKISAELDKIPTPLSAQFRSMQNKPLRRSLGDTSINMRSKGIQKGRLSLR